MSSHHMLDDGGLDNIKLQLHQHSKAILNSLSLEDCLAEEVVRNFEWYNEYCQSAYEALLQVHLKDQPTHVCDQIAKSDNSYSSQHTLFELNMLENNQDTTMLPTASKLQSTSSILQQLLQVQNQVERSNQPSSSTKLPILDHLKPLSLNFLKRDKSPKIDWPGQLSSYSKVTSFQGGSLTGLLTGETNPALDQSLSTALSTAETIPSSGLTTFATNSFPLDATNESAPLLNRGNLNLFSLKQPSTSTPVISGGSLRDKLSFGTLPQSLNLNINKDQSIGKSTTGSQFLDFLKFPSPNFPPLKIGSTKLDLSGHSTTSSVDQDLKSTTTKKLNAVLFSTPTSQTRKGSFFDLKRQPNLATTANLQQWAGSNNSQTPISLLQKALTEVDVNQHTPQLSQLGNKPTGITASSLNSQMSTFEDFTSKRIKVQSNTDLKD